MTLAPYVSNILVHHAVRNLLAGEGLEIEEMPHRQENTLCCGEGGAVSALSPDMARSWAEEKEEAHGKPINNLLCRMR